MVLGMMAWAIAAATSTTAAASTTPAGVEGLYILHRMETASAIELQPGGRFRWMFSQGALDLDAAGIWRRQDGRLVLTSDPMPIPPRFEIASRAPGVAGYTTIRVVHMDSEPIDGVDVAIRYASGDSDIGYTHDGGIARFTPEPGRTATGIAVTIAMFDLAPREFDLAPAEGEEITIRIHPNDLGTETFDALPVQLSGDALELVWRGDTLRYTRRAVEEQSE